MVKQHEDLLKKYWELIAETNYDWDEEDFTDEETLKKAIEEMENAKRIQSETTET